MEKLQSGSSEDEPLEVYLDLTHGINFMPVLTYRAVKDLLEVIAIFKDDVRFKAFNSDPYTPQAKELSINVVEDMESIPPTPYGCKIAENRDRGRPLEAIDLSKEEREELYRRKLEVLQRIHGVELSAFIGSIYNGLPLAVYRFFPDPDDLREILERSIEIYKEYAAVSSEGRLAVNRRVKFGQDFRTYLMAYVMVRMLREKGIDRKEEVSLREIRRLYEEVLKYDDRLKDRITRDIRELEKVREYATSEWEVYGIVAERAMGCLEIEGSGDKIDRRNFIAHSGFERNSIELRKYGGKLWLRYRRDLMRIVTEYCQVGLR